MPDDKQDAEQQNRTVLLGLAGLALLAVMIIGIAVLAGYGIGGD